jgi:hypothetical protein
VRQTGWAAWGIAAGIAIGLTGCGAPGAASPSLPLAADPTVMPVYAPSGREAVLDAAVYPAVIASAQDPGTWQRIAAAYAQIPQPKRPLVLVLVDPPSAQPAAAVRVVQQAIARHHVTLPWALQVGPATLYAPTTPALVTATPGGAPQRVTGLAALLRALPRAVALPHPTSPAPAKTTPGGTRP